MPDHSPITVDRIEGDRAVLELAGELIDVPLAALPLGAVEGSQLCLTLSDTIAETLDAAAARIERLAADDLPDDIQL